MTGRKTLREIREQLATARAKALPATDAAGAQEALEALDRLADELERMEDGPDEGKSQSQDEAGRTKRRT